MKDSKKKYEKKRDKIRDMKNISEAERSVMFFNNWSDYIFNSIPEETRQKNTDNHLKEMLFVRI
jgi:hypothetical protein